MRSFKIYGKWSVQTNQQTNKHTHTHAECSHASVGLAQAHPNHGDPNVHTHTQIMVMTQLLNTLCEVCVCWLLCGYWSSLMDLISYTSIL